jgi:sugar phosphate isomerase/epimerase
MKHDPTLMDPDPARRDLRIDFLNRSIDLAVNLKAEAVSFWSGRLPDQIGEDEAMERLAQALRPVVEHAESVGMRLAFEPEPGMFIDTLDRFRQLDERIHHPLFDLTLDLGHVHCLREGDLPGRIREWQGRIANIHIEDMREGVHEHLMFGEGTIDFPPILKALSEIDFSGGLHVELSRHGHMAVDAVRKSYAFLHHLLDQTC